MKRLFACVLMIIGLAACSSGASSRGGCTKGGEVCIRLSTEGPVELGNPLTLVITVSSEKEIPNLGISLITSPKTIIIEAAEGPEPGVVKLEDRNGIDWLVDIQAGETITFHRKLRFPPGDRSFMLVGYSSTPQMRAMDSINISQTQDRLDVYLSGTKIPVTDGPVPTLDPTMEASILSTILARPTETPYPTLTSFPSTDTPTLEPPDGRGYPPPETPYP